MPTKTLHVPPCLCVTNALEFVMTRSEKKEHKARRMTICYMEQNNTILTNLSSFRCVMSFITCNMSLSLQINALAYVSMCVCVCVMFPFHFGLCWLFIAWHYNRLLCYCHRHFSSSSKVSLNERYEFIAIRHTSDAVKLKYIDIYIRNVRETNNLHHFNCL